MPNLQEAEDEDFAGFEEFLTVDDDLITSELRSIEQLVDDRIQDPDEDTDDDDDAPQQPPTAAVALDSLANVRSYFASMPNSVNMLGSQGPEEAI